MNTVLLIEDNEDIRENMAEIMELSGYKVLTSPDGKEGVEAAIHHKPDIIICDIMMPVLDGYGVIHMLQKNPETQNIPFIFLTAKAERTEMRKGMELGADDYITKPFNGTELLNAIESRLRKSELRKLELSQGMKGLDELVNTVGGKDALATFAENRLISKFKKKQIIYTEGNNPHRMYFVEKGKIKAYRTNNDGKELITNLYNEGDFFGFIAILEGTTQKETAEVMEDAELAVISRDDFENLINHNPDVMKKFIKLLANNVSDRETQLLNLAYNSLRKKVADSILAINKKFYNGEPSQPMDISRENIANIAGTAKESVIRTLSDFKDEGLIEIKSGNITILNMKKLQDLLN